MCGQTAASSSFCSSSLECFLRASCRTSFLLFGLPIVAFQYSASSVQKWNFGNLAARSKVGIQALYHFIQPRTSPRHLVNLHNIQLETSESRETHRYNIKSQARGILKHRHPISIQRRRTECKTSRRVTGRAQILLLLDSLLN